MRIIAGDIGGTKTLLSCIELEGPDRRVIKQERFASGAFPTFDDVLKSFLADVGEGIIGSCFAVAGPVIRGEASITNLPWKMSADRLRAGFPLGKVVLINDFFANAYAIPALVPSDLVVINPGRPAPNETVAIIGAGTGLGEGILVPEGLRWRVIPSEGGHCDFAPANGEQAALLDKLREQYGHVSVERVVSGDGLTTVYQFLGGPLDRPFDDMPARIAGLANEGDPIARRALEMFVDCYGAEAGNLALKVLAVGGIYISGGIAAKNIERFTDGRFLAAFRSKGRMETLLSGIPIALIVNPNVGLIGAAEVALHGM